PDLYILRHGETVWNREGKFQGQQDSPLTKNGETQALRQRAILESIPNLPSTKFSSPQGRAVHTTRLALGSCDGVMLDSRLKEIDFGDWEGSTREDIKSQINYPYESGLWNFRSPNGEDFQMISARLKSFLKDMIEPAVVVTHGTTSIVLRGICMGLDQTAILKLTKDQGCVFHLSKGQESILR
ncbi:MAG: histidine phosphatase family protein, partial [Pikeienuella sp.]